MVPASLRALLVSCSVLPILLSPALARDAAQVTDDLLTLSNQARARDDLSPVQRHEGLARAAQAYAEDLAQRGELSHDAPQEGMETPGRRVARAGVALVEIAENLSFVEGDEVATRSVEGWLDSPGHRRNLLDPDYDVAGHGVAWNGRRAYVVQLLAAAPLSRRSAQARPTDGGSVVIEIRYRDEDVRLLLFVDGRHQRGAATEPGVLRAELTAPDRPVRVSVGIDRGEGRARVVEEFTLRTEPEVALVPGGPAADRGGQQAP